MGVWLSLWDLEKGVGLRLLDSEKKSAGWFKCEGCKKRVDIEKSLSIYRFPRVLTIHLKRFYHSAMRREKLNTTVKFPESLDVSKYAPHSSKSISLPNLSSQTTPVNPKQNTASSA